MTELRIEQASKTYSEQYKLGPINLSFSERDTVAVLGKNGAGKTTLFQLLSANLDLTEGKITLNGEDIRPEAFNVKRKIGYLPQHLPLPSWVSAAEILRYASKLMGSDSSKERINKILEYWDCTSFQNRPMAACSHGMQKRVGLALASFHDPELLILDEPFSGLDIYHIRALDNVIDERRRAGKCTLISTHIAPYAARFCNRALFLVDGTCKEALEWPGFDQSARVNHMESFFFGKSAHATTP